MEKLPEVYRKQDLLEILCVNLYKVKAFVECGIVLQYVERNSPTNFLFILDKINNLPNLYIDYLMDVFFIEKMVEKFYIIGEGREILERLV